MHVHMVISRKETKDIIGDIRNPRTTFLLKNPHPFTGLDYPTHLTYLLKADCRP